MTTTTTELSPTEAETRRRPPVWHVPADMEQHANARMGLPWVARCGRRAKRTMPGTEARRASQLAPIERCVVCVELRP